MAVCFFYNDFKNKYHCDYNIKDNGIEVIVDYDIDSENEIEGIEGILISVNQYKKRNIIIIDNANKKNILMKDAFYNGHTSNFGSPDSGYKTKFFSNVYFLHGDYLKLYDFPLNSKVIKIQVFSDSINDFIGFPSLRTTKSESDYNLNFKFDRQIEEIELKCNNISKLVIGDYWRREPNSRCVHIDLTGFIEINLINGVDVDAVYQYVYELIIYMQLYYQNKFLINKILITIDDICYEMSLYFYNLEYKDKLVDKSLGVNILDFLKNCYCSIPYRNSKSEIRNIPYIVLNTNRSLEDNFLMFYRFIECYYKRNNHRNDFISYSLLNNHKDELNFSIEDLTAEIISLRNHYVHTGYFIDNCKLKIEYKKINGKKNPRNYFATNVDFDWILLRTKILYDIVIDIIYRNMLSYEEYIFNKCF